MNSLQFISFMYVLVFLVLKWSNWVWLNIHSSHNKELNTITIRKGVFINHPNVSHDPKTFGSIKDPELQRFVLGLYLFSF